MDNYPDTMDGMKEALDKAHKANQKLQGELEAKERIHQEELRIAQEKIEYLHLQKTMDAQLHLEEMSRAQEQSTARIALLQEENANLRLEAAADVLRIQNLAAHEIATSRAQTRQRALILQQQAELLRNRQEEIRDLEAFRQMFRVGQAVMINLNEIRGEGRQIVNEALGIGENDVEVVDLQADEE